MILTHGANSIRRAVSPTIYTTDFSGLDFSTGEDKGFVWSFTRRKDLLSKGSFEILGKQRNALKFASGSNTPEIGFDKSQIVQDIFTLELECWIPFNDVRSFSGGLEYAVVAPYFNMFDSSRGIGVKDINLNNLQLYNDFTYNSPGYGADWYGRFDNSKIIKGGMSVDITTGRVGAFLFDKKAISGISSNLGCGLDIYFDTTAGDAYVLKFSITEGFKFDELT